MPHTIEKDFSFTYHTKTTKSTLSTPVTIPLSSSSKEFAARLIQAHNLPCFVVQDLESELQEFVTNETASIYDKNADEAIKKVKDNESAVNELLGQWVRTYSQELRMFAKPFELSRDEKFAEVYHTLIHSPALETLLNLEHEYSLGVEKVIKERNRSLQQLQEKMLEKSGNINAQQKTNTEHFLAEHHHQSRQRREMDVALSSVGAGYRDEDINLLAQRQFEETQTVESKWASELSFLHEQQKAEYREWVFRVNEDSQGNATLPSYVQRLRSMSSVLPDAEEDERQAVSSRLEESFTIHLGAQMKTTHNLRLLCTDILDLCQHKPHTVGLQCDISIFVPFTQYEKRLAKEERQVKWIECRDLHSEYPDLNPHGVVIPQPQRLQTAMSLYSNNLCGMLLLVDNRLNSYTGIKQKFARVCESSTDFHFPPLERQYELIEQHLPRAAEVRNQKRLASGDDADQLSLHSSSSGGSSEEKEKGGERKLHSGDFYVTKHSNLSEVHIVFHVVTDENLRTSEITSRHPVILSIRNIIKLCFRYDIHTIAIPLLLTHEMTEEMTISWCMKRAELLFKCVKGFMIEMATYSSQESKTIQFLVPWGLSEELFHQISNMIPTIFRLSNPLVVKSN